MKEEDFDFSTAKITTDSSINRYIKMVSVLSECSKLNDWEEGFVDSITQQKYPYTDNQRDKIEKLYQKYIGGDI